MILRHFATSDVGMKRTHNEDSFLVMEGERLFIVCDGMGGHSSGEVASKIAVDTISNFFKETSEDSDVTWPYRVNENISLSENRLINGIKLSNLRIFESASADIIYKGMGTTVVSLYILDHEGIICHVGDSRAYRIRDNNIQQLTEDHSLLNDYKKIAQLTEEEIKNFPHKNVIVRALGMKENVEVDLIKEKVQFGDIYLLCSDGLSGEVEDAMILKIITDHKDDLELAGRELIKAACEHGGKDNITAILVYITDSIEQTPAVEPESAV
jgi:protein phosphatase